VPSKPIALFALLLLTGCPGTSGTFDGGIFPDAGPGVAPITAADIGTRCEYRYDGANPTNTCGAGLSCLIYTLDGAYLPNPRGSNANFTLSVWEDQFTVYRADEVDEGYCTLLGTWQQPPSCPVGTQLKLFSTNLAACVKSCSQPADCGRSDYYTCDVRYQDVSGPVCVRKCGLDVPDCVRSGQFQRPNGPIAMHLDVADLTGSSYCDVGSGICAGNPGQGFVGPGQICNSTLDCGPDTVCLQGQLLQAINPNLPGNAPGFCGQPCKYFPADPLAGGCAPGFACQPGFTFGHGDPADVNLEDANGFLLVNFGAGDSFLEAGGFCFPDCQANGGNCAPYPGTQCGAANPATFGYAWNQVSMCLVDPLRL
jgi:hypothetical protein